MINCTTRTKRKEMEASGKPIERASSMVCMDSFDFERTKSTKSVMLNKTLRRNSVYLWITGDRHGVQD